MRTEDFNYRLPEERIAQTPIEPRHNSKLLVYDRKSKEIKHEIFKNIGQYLSKDDLIVINQTKVIPARIFAKKETVGKVEILLLKQIAKENRKRNLGMLGWGETCNERKTSCFG